MSNPILRIPQGGNNYIGTAPQSVQYSQPQQIYYNTPLSNSINLQPQFQTQSAYSPLQQVPRMQTVQSMVPGQYEIHHEVRHVERPLEVISIDEIENPWRLKCATLERQILELQIQYRKGMPSETVEVVDDTKVRHLEKQINELKNLQLDRDNEIDVLQQRINELNAQIEESGTSQVTYLTTEIETWQRKFKELEHDLVQTEKDLEKAEAELKRLQRDQVAASSVRDSGRKGTKI